MWGPLLLLRSLTLLGVTIYPGAQALDAGSPVAPNGTTATFVGIEQSAPGAFGGEVRFGTLGGVWPNMPGPYDTPLLCRCATLASPVTLRIRIEGRGGVRVTIAEEESRVLLSTVDLKPDPSPVLASWVITGAVRLFFSPGANVRGLFLDPAIPLTSISHPPPWLPPRPVRGLRIEADR